MDGREEKVQPLINKAFLGVVLKEGNHNVKFVYNTPGQKAGICVSLLSVLIFAVFEFLFRNKEEKIKS